MCTGLIGKDSDKSKKRFNIVKYKEKYDLDKAAVEALIPRSEGMDSLASKMLCQKESSIESVTGDVESHGNPLVGDKPKVDVAAAKKKYVCFTFDNLSPMLRPSGAMGMGDEDEDPFCALNDFVNVVVASCAPTDTEVLLIIASPGGYAFKFEQSYSDLLRLRGHGFKVTGIVDSICASGGYMLACGCNRIVCSPYAQIGSVGVIAQMHNYSKLLDKVGVEAKTFATGKYKAGFPGGEPYTEDDVEITRELIGDTLGVFRRIVQTARAQADIDQLLTARVWYGQEALDRHMVDELIVTSDDFLCRLCKPEGAEVFMFEPGGKSGGALTSLIGAVTERAGAGLVRSVQGLLKGVSAAGSRVFRQQKPVGFVEL